MDEIADWRKKIDEIDTQLAALLNERAACAVEIGKVKARDGMEITNPERESEVINNICEKNNGPLDDDTLQVLFRQIIDACKSLE